MSAYVSACGCDDGLRCRAVAVTQPAPSCKGTPPDKLVRALPHALDLPGAPGNSLKGISGQTLSNRCFERIYDTCIPSGTFWESSTPPRLSRHSGRLPSTAAWRLGRRMERAESGHRMSKLVRETLLIRACPEGPPQRLILNESGATRETRRGTRDEESPRV